MAFNNDNLATSGAHSTDTPTVWTYKTSDLISSVTADNYFWEKRFVLLVGDIVFIYTQGNMYQYVVTSVTPAVTVQNVIPETSYITDPVTGKIAQVETNGALAVNVQDQHSRAFDLFFAQDVGSPSSLTTDVVQDAYTLLATTGHGLVQGDFFILVDPVGQRGWTGTVITVAGNNTVNVDRPISYAFPSASTVLQKRTKAMNVDGSSTPQTFSIGGSLLAQLDITRILFQMTTSTAPEWDEFGDIEVDATFRGIQCRLVNGTTTDLWNAKTNGELANLMYDMTVFLGSAGLTKDGIAGRMTYAGQNKHGVTLRISANEALEIIIQDDLRGLDSLSVIACGHFVTD
jgi:hypothetical protein